LSAGFFYGCLERLTIAGQCDSAFGKPKSSPLLSRVAVDSAAR
jgi:hypothetical protein